MLCICSHMSPSVRLWGGVWSGLSMAPGRKLSCVWCCRHTCHPSWPCLLPCVSWVSPGSVPAFLQFLCPFGRWMCLFLDVGVSLSVCPWPMPPRVGVSNRVSLPVCPVQLDSVEDGVVRILCFFCPPRPRPCPRSEALSFLCSTAQAGRGQACLVPWVLPVLDSPSGVCQSTRPSEATELWAAVGLAGTVSTGVSLSRREPSRWGLVTGRSFRPRWLTRCLSAAAVWPCSSASWVSLPSAPAQPSLSCPQGLVVRGRGPACLRQVPPSLSSPCRHHQRAVSVLCRPHGAQGALPVSQLPEALRRLPRTLGPALPSQIQVPLLAPLPPGPWPALSSWGLLC